MLNVCSPRQLNAHFVTAKLALPGRGMEPTRASATACGVAGCRVKAPTAWVHVVVPLAGSVVTFT